MALRVVIVSHWGERQGGAEEMLWLALSNCDRRRLDPTVVFLGQGEWVEEVAELGFDVEVIETGRLRQPRETLGTVRRLAGVVRRVRPDLLLGWSARTHFYGAPAAALAGMGNRVVWWQHDIPNGHWIDRIATVLPATAIGCSSRASREAQRKLAPRRPAFVVNPGIDPAPFGNGAGAGLREALGIPAGRLVVGIVGRVQAWKGQDRFLEALAELHRRGRDVHGLIVGGAAFGLSPEYSERVRRMIPELGLAGRVTMTGQVEDSAPYFGLMDVAVNASEGEPFGIVLLEAMAAGVPVVAVAMGGPLEIVEPGVTGVLAASGRPGALADAIDSLLDDPARRDEIAAAARRRCVERFSAAAMSDRLTESLWEAASHA
jgi:glycosyltransferase involved in cell wall biosynthesis